jgi:hypothetical protein
MSGLSLTQQSQEIHQLATRSPSFGWLEWAQLPLGVSSSSFGYEWPEPGV